MLGMGKVFLGYVDYNLAIGHAEKAPFGMDGGAMGFQIHLDSSSHHPWRLAMLARADKSKCIWKPIIAPSFIPKGVSQNGALLSTMESLDTC